MGSLNRWLIGLSVLFILGIVSTPAQAETPFDFTLCSSGLMTFLSSSEGIHFFGVERKGIAMSNHENKVFDNCTMQLVGVGRGPTGNPVGFGYLKLLSPDGDFVIGELSGTLPDMTLKFLQGSGKWKGITGLGKGQSLTVGKPIIPGTVQSCARYKGSFEVPK
jgi:hypothetical protein